MLDIERFYAAAGSGEKADVRAVSEFIGRFKYVVLWGAGNFGRAIGKKFRQMGLPISAYWDLRAGEIPTLNGIEVLEPFTGKFDPALTLVVPCITNGSMNGEWTTEQLHSRGYHNILLGQKLFEGLICPINKDGRLDPKVCLDATMCNICGCDRFVNLVHHRNSAGAPEKSRKPLRFHVVTLIVNQKCSLRCTHCGQHMNKYPAGRRVNFPLARIRDDIDKVFAAVDTIGVVSIIGGEAFLHPDINAIVEHVLGKRNFGAINVTTNGIYRIDPDRLDLFKNDRIKISFSDYTSSLSSARKEIFRKNVAMVESKGINFSVGVPIWSMPGSLRDHGHPVETLTAMKAGCGLIKMCMSVKNGKYYPCSATETVNCLGLADYPTDYVDVAGSASPEELRERIGSVLNRPYYESCRHCGEEGGLLACAGEQCEDERCAV